MFDFRYHALSLAAVLIALTVGLLLGVAIGDANLVSNAERHLRNSLRSDLDAARRAEQGLRAQIGFRNGYESQVYGQIVGSRLAGRRIGLIFLGTPSDPINGLVRSALDGTGAQLALVAVVREPPDLAGIAAAASGTRYGALGSDGRLLGPLGARLGTQFVHGGRLIGRLQQQLLSSYNGTLEPLDGVILMRNRSAFNSAEERAVGTFENGLATGLADSHVPVVGIETVATNPSIVPWYQQQRLASVDDVDDIAGRTALIYALAGAHGSYGVKRTAQALLPAVPPLGSR